MTHYTRKTVQKLEAIFNQLDYLVRYERGSFQSGYCVVEDRKIVVINKFFDTDGRAQTMLEILSKMAIEDVDFAPDTRKYLNRHLRSYNESVLS